MANQKSTHPQPETGGSWIRNPKTGDLTKNTGASAKQHDTDTNEESTDAK